MSLIDAGEVPVFNREEIRRGYAIWAKHATWDEGRTGYVSAVSNTALVVVFPPGINRVVNHFLVGADEVDAGEWQIRYSADLRDVSTYPVEDGE